MLYSPRGRVRITATIRTAGDRWMLVFPRVGRCPTSARRRRKEREPPLWQTRADGRGETAPTGAGTRGEGGGGEPRGAIGPAPARRPAAPSAPKIPLESV